MRGESAGAHDMDMASSAAQGSSRITAEWPAAPRREARLLAALELLVAIPAIPSGIGLMRDGMGLDRRWIAHTLLPDYTIPGLLLLLLIGGGMSAAAVVTLRRPQLARPLGLTAGIVLLAWLAIETLMLGWHGGPQLPLDVAYGGLAAGLAAAGLRGLRLTTSDH